MATPHPVPLRGCPTSPAPHICVGLMAQTSGPPSPSRAQTPAPMRREAAPCAGTPGLYRHLCLHPLSLPPSSIPLLSLLGVGDRHARESTWPLCPQSRYFRRLKQIIRDFCNADQPEGRTTMMGPRGPRRADGPHAPSHCLLEAAGAKMFEHCRRRKKMVFN